MIRTMTDMALLKKLVPDIEERIKKLKETEPAVADELEEAVLWSDKGWRPLHWQRGCL